MSNFVAMDIVEVSPPYDHAEMTALAASALIDGVSLPQGLAEKGARAIPLPDVSTPHPSSRAQRRAKRRIELAPPRVR